MAVRDGYAPASMLAEEDEVGQKGAGRAARSCKGRVEGKNDRKKNHDKEKQGVRFYTMHKKAMVVGGGVAGIQAALDLADMGIETFLVEKGPSIGGRMAQLDKTFPTNDCAMCILSPKLVQAGSHPYLHLITHGEVTGIEGTPPHLKVSVLKKPRYVDESKCTGCGICVTKCPTKVPDPYNKGLSQTKAIRIPFPQAVPAIAVIDSQKCLYLQKGKCRICEKSCGTNAIDFNQKEERLTIEVGSVILACGTTEFDAKLKGEYGYGIFPNVLTSIEYERILSASGPTGGHISRPSDHKEPKKDRHSPVRGFAGHSGRQRALLCHLLHAGRKRRNHHARTPSRRENDDFLHGHTGIWQGV